MYAKKIFKEANREGQKKMLCLIMKVNQKLSLTTYGEKFFHMVGLKTLHHRRVVKIWKDGHRQQKCSLTAKLQTCDIILPCLPPLKLETREGQGHCHLFPIAGLADTRAMKYELKSTLKEMKEILSNSLADLHPQPVPSSSHTHFPIPGTLSQMRGISSHGTDFWWLTILMSVIYRRNFWLVTGTQF